MKCRHWKDPHDWAGDQPDCAFTKRGKFRLPNWSCYLMLRLRQLCEDDARWNDDQHLAILSIPNSCSFAVLSWYKSRGQTEGFWIITANEMREGTEKDALKILGKGMKP